MITANLYNCLVWHYSSKHPNNPWGKKKNNPKGEIIHTWLSFIDCCSRVPRCQASYIKDDKQIYDWLTNFDPALFLLKNSFTFLKVLYTLEKYPYLELKSLNELNVPISACIRTTNNVNFDNTIWKQVKFTEVQQLDLLISSRFDSPTISSLLPTEHSFEIFGIFFFLQS